MDAKTTENGQQLLQNKYTSAVRLPLRGDAWKAEYKRGEETLPCFIRYGTREQLLKQRSLLQQVYGSIPVPVVIDYYETAERACLVTEWIGGEPADKLIHTTFLRRSWWQLSRRRKKLLMGWLYEIAAVTRQLHQLGYVHGKLRPDKFLVQENKVYLVDMGTAQEPGDDGPKTTADDMYTLGLLLLHFLTNYVPAKFDIKQPAHLYETLYYLVQDKAIVQLVLDCLNSDAALRPDVDAVLKELDAFIVRIASGKFNKSAQFTVGVQTAIRPEDMVRESLLLPLQADGPYAPVTNAGWKSGMAGINYVTARCPLPDITFRTIDGEGVTPVTAPGLYDGLAGVAVTLAATGNSNLEGWFVAPEALDIAGGAAGQLLAVLHVLPMAGADAVGRLALPYVDYLLLHQAQDGSWPVPENAVAWSYGMAGIAGILWQYGSRLKEDRALDAAAAAMNWLDRQPLPQPEREGIAQVTARALAGLWAYDATKDPGYANKAEQLLNLLPEFWQTSRFGYEEGYAGLGELYLEAWRLTKNFEWKRRAHLVFSELIHLKKLYNKGFYWITEAEAKPLPGLLTGNAGILHFLMRYTAGAEVVPHLLLPV